MAPPQLFSIGTSLLSALALALAGCGGDPAGPTLLIQVSGLPDDTQMVQADFLLGDADGGRQATPMSWPRPTRGFGGGVADDAGLRTSFVAVLPAGTRGALTVEVTARRTDSCVTARGQAVTTVSSDGRSTLDLALATLATPDCTPPGQCGGAGEKCCAGGMCSGSLRCLGDACSCALELASGFGFTCVRRSDGRAWCWGAAGYAQAGGVTGGRPGPGIQPPDRVTALAMGGAHMCQRADDGTAWCTGLNVDGQLGAASYVTPYTSYLQSRTASALLTGVDQIAAGSEHTCWRVGGTVLCAGVGTDGRLGYAAPDACPTGGVMCSNVAAPVTGLPEVIGLAAGERHTCAIVAADRSVVCWGRGMEHQLGQGQAASSQTPVQAGTLTGVAQLALGFQQSCALTQAGEVFCWGKNDVGQVGDGTGAPRPQPTKLLTLVGGARVQKLVSTDLTTCALREDGTMWCWGDNTNGQMARPAAELRMSLQPVKLTLPLLADISLGQQFACGLTRGGRVLCWGNNAVNQLGMPTAAQGGIDSGFDITVPLTCP